MKLSAKISGLLVVGLGVAGCGSGGHAAATRAAVAPTSVTPSTAASVDYGKQYLADIGPANTAARNLMKAYGNAQSVTAAQVQPLRDAYVTFGRELVSQSWPANAQTDVHELALATEQAAADLANGLDVSNMGAVSQDATKFTSVAQIVRADLGLPPVQNS